MFVEDVTIEGIRETKRTWDEGSLRPRLARWHGANVDIAFHGWCDTWLDPGFRDWNIVRRLRDIRIPVLVMQERTTSTERLLRSRRSRARSPAQSRRCCCRSPATHRISTSPMR